MEDKTVTQQLLQLRTLSKASCIRKFIELYGYEPKQTKNVPALRARLAFRVQELHYGGIADSTRQKINEYADKSSRMRKVRNEFKDMLGKVLLSEEMPEE